MSPRFKGPFFVSVGILLILGPAVQAQSVSDAEQAILDLYANKQLFDRAKYKTVRAAFAKHFETKHEKVITSAYASDLEAIKKWMADHPNFKEDFYTALDERFDRIGPALEIFRDLWKKKSAAVEKHPNLTIATAITWDDPRAIYDYRGHQERTKSVMPKDLVDGIANFEYIVSDKNLDARCKNLPWEFLVFVVDHRTPLKERAWAQQYSRAAVGLSSWHKDVPFDHAMLDSELGKGPKVDPKLHGQDYSLVNIRILGGVCAMQADFAARVGKSVGVPAVYCSGESAYRGGHAWWMYVQVLQATTDRVQFSLNSDGRFVGFVKDAFYTGMVLDPRSGKRILDRDMERRLHLAGSDSTGKRQADLLMRSYPWLSTKQDWDVEKRVAYLDKVLKLCPLCEEPWLEFARLVKQNELQLDQKAVVKKYLASVQSQFKNYPDFIERVLPDMLSLYDPAEQIKTYQQALLLYQKAGRPDLACQACIDISESLGKQEKWQAAFDGLVATLYRFPTEGRYIPKLLQRTQDICGNVKGGNERVAQIYVDFVPKLAVYYRGDDSTIADKLYKQGQTFLSANKLDSYANALRLRMGK